ncbi:HlyD family efflux transporter periplasmic adaptor subunit [Oscillatoria sp. FACHB-1407]|uniref:HlyD family efflux transporter periplasmic adaptor subunit n=1 Tax=Oscillatoria sp. FACHB-1407 TaxID=2692847 RepID=UPI001683FCC5|nr:HlyD family efflux transporter periplasmic adaptor subunit [Oscillatoria sp. FACHB-1407]MBD2460992.1 HlyD family efflux transporter periplasmic adaptor subunit [Oscillatoria sp. FACHB-1407]
MNNLPASNGQNGGNGNGTKPIRVGALTTVNDAATEDSAPSMASNKLVRAEAFDQPVILQQTSLWSRSIVYGIVGVTIFVLGWAYFARIEEAVPATGKLEPQDRVQEVQAPVGGVIEEILVEDGQQVKEGDVLIRFDTTAAAAQQRSLQQIRSSLLQENNFYRSQLSGVNAPVPEGAGLTLPPEMLALTSNRATLIAENQIFRAQLTGSSNGAGLTPEQQARLQSGLLETQSAAAAARLEVSQLQRQLSQTQVQLSTARATLEIDQGIIADIRPLVEEGGLARIQYLRQQQEVMNGQAEVDRLTQEQQRLQFAIAQAGEKYQNTVALSQNNVLARLSENEKRLAEIDSQLNKAIVENEKRLAEIDSQLSETELTLRYQELRAPVNGTVFDLQAKGTGFVANTSEPILKIVPTDALVAEVYITNQDIGFVREGMPVDVRIDSFPFSEFGDVKGTVTNIGSDALPPDQINPYYRFPAQITLEQQFLRVGEGRDAQDVQLQSGMSVTANIITRDRTVLSIFTDLFSRRIESLKTVR